VSEWIDTLGPWWSGNVKYKKDGRDFLVFQTYELDSYTTVAAMIRELEEVAEKIGYSAMVGIDDYTLSATGARRPTDDERAKIKAHAERLAKQRSRIADQKKDRDARVIERLRREYPGEFVPASVDVVPEGESK